jgi:fused signal recognition particle receptor
MGLFSRLFSGLSKTRKSIASGLSSIFSAFSSIDDEFYEELEETLIMADLGINATEAIVESLKEKVKETIREELALYE